MGDLRRRRSCPSPATAIATNRLRTLPDTGRDSERESYWLSIWGPQSRFRGLHSIYYTPVAACFVGEANCTQPPAIVASSAPKNCLTQCTAPDCINYGFDSVPGNPQEGQARMEVAKAASQLLSSPTLNNISLTAPFGIKQLCANRGLLAIQGGTFSEGGSTCDAWFPVRSSPNAPTLHFFLPPQLSGTFSRVLNQRASFDFPDPWFSPRLEWLDASGFLGNENVAHIEVSRGGLVKIVGTLHFCIWVRAGYT